MSEGIIENHFIARQVGLPARLREYGDIPFKLGRQIQREIIIGSWSLPVGDGAEGVLVAGMAGGPAAETVDLHVFLDLGGQLRRKQNGHCGHHHGFYAAIHFFLLVTG